MRIICKITKRIHKGYCVNILNRPKSEVYINFKKLCSVLKEHQRQINVSFSGKRPKVFVKTITESVLLRTIFTAEISFDIDEGIIEWGLSKLKYT